MIKRIVFVSIFQPEWGGGHGRVAQEIAEYFASDYRTGCEVALICPGDQTGLKPGPDPANAFNLRI